MGDMKEETSEMVIGEHAIETVSVDKTTNNEFVSENTTTELEFSEKETFDEILSENKTVESVCAKETKEAVPEETAKETVTEKKLVVVFVLGGPGGGKSTQCAKIAKEVGYTHLSSGDLLRQTIKSDPVNGPMIEAMIKEGKSVPPDITMEILQKAIEESENDKFILDGFPRDEEIRAAFESATKTEPELVLFFECSEEERERRILSRNQGRVDDNSESVRKRFRYFQEHTLPVVHYYKRKGLVLQIDAGRLEEEVFETLKSILGPSTTMQAEEAPITEELGKKISELGL
ncbi:hypothetical protein P3X46_028237 [Hevea brasiliensis]|uniref:adenylate kinase n=1 Tax=Hevea brasiliensis TaxID=3981 RepID=A0ABQ9KP05_HEVBR|nr:UMP-CMP kinase 3 [Hevea brasiliensis]XP_021688611.2 UMP-CMP kinase 3 [Hevea brasiliensis]KAJ9145909.1 hypothetical protein P3X46_028237 [Hevea brasiliensis]KAJ9145910.1 hypothetical protein P3X46_028237 [Hevea brasiliensis]